MKNTILFFRYVILIGYLCCLLPLHAQKRTVLALRDTLTGKDSILLHVSLAESSPQKRQYSIAVKTDKLLSQEYTPAQVPLYREGSQNYLSRILWTQGIKRQVFLPRILWQVRDTLSVFLFINDRKQKEYYYQFGNGKEVLPLAVVSDGRVRSALEEYLSDFPIAQEDEQLRQYIQRMKPTPNSYKKRRLVCVSGNINYIPRFRWGILLGGGYSQLKLEDNYSFKKQFQWYAGAFADIPILQKGFSFHPELAFLKVSALQVDSPDFNRDLAYNRTTLRMPLLLRYTAVLIRGKVLPYLQFGPEMGFRIKGDTKTHRYLTDPEGYIKNSEVYQEKNKNFLIAGTVGLGVEIKIQRRHSLFIDARYLIDIMEDNNSFKISGWFGSVAYNL